MKRNLIILMFIVSLFMVGCNKKTEKTIIFDSFKINLKSQYNYQDITANTLPDVPIIKQYIQETDDKFANSIVIAKKPIKIEINIEEFINNNIKSMSKNLIGFGKAKKTKIAIKCKDNKIKGIIQQFRVKESDHTQYINQLFLSKDESLYGVSTMTLNKSEHNSFYKALKSINCL